MSRGGESWGLEGILKDIGDVVLLALARGYHHEKAGYKAQGGALRYRMATHCQTGMCSGSGEHQNIRAVNSFEGRKGGRSTSN